MKKILIILLLLFLHQDIFSQSFSYSFKGSLDEQSKERIQTETLKLPGVLSYELKYKEDSAKGEILISLDPMTDRGENDHPFNPADLKSILISVPVEPINFRQIK